MTLQLVWYTDPHNIWCWGYEPTIRRLEVLYPDTVEIEVRQGGLFEDFSPVREQWARMSGGRWKDSVGAFFEAVAAQHRMPMNTEAMLASVDDFNSTWPACIAAKAAGLQGRDAGRAYLRRLREAWTLEGRGIHARSVQEAIASESGLNIDSFRSALDDGSAERAFQADRTESQELGITGFPTFVLHQGPESVRTDGWRPWEAIDDFLRELDPHIEPRPLAASETAVRELLRRYGRLATPEVAAVLGATDDDAEILLEELEGSGSVRRRAVGNGLIWESKDRAGSRHLAEANAPPGKHAFGATEHEP